MTRCRELRTLRQLKRTYAESAFLFVAERGGPITEATVRKMMARAGQEAHIGLPVHPHMLRHAIGFYLANKRSAYTHDSGVSGAPQHRTHRALHSTRTGAIPRALARLITRTARGAEVRPSSGQ